MFKVGDRVLCVSSPVGDEKDEYVGQIVTVSDVMDGRIRNIKEWENHGWGYQNDWFELVNGNGKRGRPRTKPAPVNFLLKYDLDEDPIEEFETMEQVKERIKQLSTRSDFKRDSIVVYHIKRKQIATIETKVTIK